AGLPGSRAVGPVPRWWARIRSGRHRPGAGGGHPIVVAASGPAMTTLAAEVGDGWMPPYFAPGVVRSLQHLLNEGFARSGDPNKRETFDIWAHVDMLVDDDVRAAMRPFKEYAVRYSALQRPFMEARGYGDLAERLAELRDAGRLEEAIQAIPDEYIDDGW